MLLTDIEISRMSVGLLHSSRGYRELLLEEIALEGLDGITLDALWERLDVNKDWSLKPIDNLVEEFVWNHLIAVTEVNWFILKEPRECPLIYSSSDEYLTAVNKNKTNPNIADETYQYCEVKNDEEIGSCAEYETREEVTEEIGNFKLSEVKVKWGNNLVVVAHQHVRNYVLFSGNMLISGTLDVTTYCILERIGRARSCGELSTNLNFIKNGANPTFYFWNKLRKKKLITSQSVSLKQKCSTLFFLKKFHRTVGKCAISTLTAVIESIEASPKKACTLVELKEMNPRISKLLKNVYYRDYLQILKVPYSEFYPDGKQSRSKSKNGSERNVTIVKLADNVKQPKEQRNEEESDDEDEYDLGILDERRLLNKPLLSQCFHAVDQAAENGISQTGVSQKLGISKLLTRTLLKVLMKFSLVVNMAPEHANKRFFNYYSKNYSYVKEMKLQAQKDKSFQILEASWAKDAESLDDPMDVSFYSDRQPVEFDKSDGRESVNSEKVTLGTKRRLSNMSTEIQNVKKLKTSDSEKSSDVKGKEDNIIEIKCDSIYMMRRINIILEHVYKNQVELQMNLKTIVMKEEQNQGYSQGTLDRKSLRNAISLIVQSGKVKVITVTVTEPTFNKSKDIKFVCIPDVTENHPMIQEAMKQTKDSLSIMYVKHANPQNKSQMDLKALVHTDGRTTQYGYAPKFVRMKVLHEVLSYLLLSYEGDENLNQEECKQFVTSICPDFDPEEKLPKCYLKELSWKMFIPPLMKYEEYSDGWVSQTDVVDRFPLRLLFMIMRLPHEVPNLDKYLRHPIKQHYLVRDLPVDMQKIIRVDKRYLYALTLTYRALATIGLVQFGPRTNARANMNLVYLNRKTELFDTRIAPPGYSKINLSLTYPKHCYSLNSLSDVEMYWSDAMRFSLGTKLGCKKNIPISGTQEKLPQRLREVFEPCAIKEASARDVGFVPGDGKGALGFDSSLYSHLVRSWFFSPSQRLVESKTAPQSSMLKPTKLMTQIASRKTISKVKKFRFVAQKKPTTTKKKSQKLTYDTNDIEALKNLKTLRVQWTKTEDDLLIMAFLAASYSGEYQPGYRPARLIRKLLCDSCEKGVDKTALACNRRIYRLMKNSIREHAVGVSLKELSQDITLKQKCQPFIDELESQTERKDQQGFKTTLDKMTEFVFSYLRDGTKIIEVSDRGGYDTSLPDDLESFKQLCDFEYPNTKADSSLIIQTDTDIRVLTIVNLIFSTLLSQVDKNKMLNMNYLHRVFVHFDESHSKIALSYVRQHRLISFNKSTDRSRSSYLPIGQGVYHLSLTLHLILKAVYSPEVYSQIYQRYLDLSNGRKCEGVELSSYDAGLSALLIAYFVSNQITFDLRIPENILVFNGKPTLLIDPEKIVKPMFDAKNKYTDQTLTLIKETFFEGEADVKMKMESRDKSNHEDCVLKNSDSDSEIEIEKDDDSLTSHDLFNITVNLTRRQFKHSDTRFSHAYDLFVINMFPLKYDVTNINPDQIILPLEERLNCKSSVETDFMYRKVKFTNDEISSKIKEHLALPKERDFAISILEFLRQRGMYGATCAILKEEFPDLGLLKTVTNALCKSKQVLRCGSKYTHYVHLDFAATWLLPCQSSVELFVERISTTEKSATQNKIKGEKLDVNNEEQVWVNIKPWVHSNGTLNQEALSSLLIRVLSYIVKYPGKSLKQVQHKFVPALQSHATRELVEILEHLKCVSSCVLVYNGDIDLFSQIPVCTVNDKTTGFEDEDLIILEPDVNAMVKFSTFMATADYKDLLETKYTMDPQLDLEGVGEMEPLLDVSSAIHQPRSVQGEDVSQDSN